MKYLLLIILYSLTTSILAQSWKIDTLTNLPEPITNNAVVEGYQNGSPFIYTFGGLDSTKSQAGIHLRSYKYDVQNDSWQAITSLPDTMGKIAAGATRIKDKIYIMGGYHVFPNGNEISSNKVHIYDCEADSFLADGAPIPVATDDHVQGLWQDSLIYVITGWSNTTNIPNVQIYNPTTDSWTVGSPVPNNTTFASFGASGGIIGNTIYYFGGASMAGAFNIQSKFRLGRINPNNPQQINWSSFDYRGWRGYRMAAALAFGNIYWIGGSDVTYNYDGIAYNGTGGVSPNGNITSFDPVAGIPSGLQQENNYPLPMDLRGIASVGDSTHYLAGGMLPNQQVSQQLLRLSWSPVVLSNTSSSLVAPLEAGLVWNLSPNPIETTTLISIEKFTPKTTYSLNTIQGVQLQQGTIEIDKQILDFSEIQAGWYLLTIQNGTSCSTKKVFIQ
jgi:hypothetical protein